MKWTKYFAIVFLFTLPTLIGYLTNQNMVFSGLIHTTDGNNYLSIINQAREGKVLFTNMFTYEEVPYLIVRPIFMVAGWISALTGLSSILVYHLFRILAIIFFVYYLDKLISLIFKNEKQRNVAFVICIFASGIGYLLKLLTLLGIKQYGSIDLWVTDANNFQLMLSHAHGIFSIGLMAASSYHLLSWFRKSGNKDLAMSALMILILGFEHLFDVITLYMAVAFLFLYLAFLEKRINWRKTRHLMILGLVTSVPFLHSLIMFVYLPQYQAWNSQNILETPKFIHVVFGYGGMFLALVAVVFYLIRQNFFSKEDLEIKFMIFWIVSVFILIYSPFNIQRRFLEGAHIPFGIITVFFLFSILAPFLSKSIGKTTTSKIVMILVILMLPTNLYFYFRQVSHLDNERGTFPFEVNRYLYYEETEALKWLSENSKNDEIILSTYNIGNHIPGHMNRRVFLGHWAQTIEFDKKSNEVLNFFKNGIKFKDFGKIRYIWYGVDERIINSNFVPPDNFEIAFQNPRIQIFKVKS